MLIYYILIFLMSILGSIGLYFLLNKFTNKKEVILKIISVVVCLIMAIRYMLANPAIGQVQGLNMFSPFGDAILKTFIGQILVWFTYASIFLIGLNSFFKIKNLNNLVKFLAFPTLILDALLFNIYAVSIVGTNAFTNFDFRMILISIEIVVSISYMSAVFIRKDYFKISKEELKNLLLSLVPVLLAIMPAYSIQSLIGYTSNANLKFESFTPEHRIMLYLSIIVPVSVYLALKNKSEDVRRFSLIYLSLGTLWTFMYRFLFADFASPMTWPIHLCHTAMYIVPLCLIFKMDRLFYFTLFINVMGAFLAMAMPNTDSVNIFTTDSIIFWVNHFSAFFMPALVVCLGMFKRPKMKQWFYSMLAFLGYFIFVLIINAWFSNYGEVDFFYLNSDFIVDKLGAWAENTRNYTVSFKVKELTLTFYPLYQTLFFFVYVLISFGVWFLYEQLFQIIDVNEERRLKNKEYKKIQKELEFLLKGRSIDEPMSGDNKPCLELKSFSKKYGTNKHYSVKDASFKVNGGEIFGFLGPNGAGKSTIIKSIVGIQTITEGNIEICGYDVQRQSVQSKKEIGFVPDHYALYENLTGREYINYIADLYEVSKEDRDERINRYVTNFSLEHAFDNQMKTYSHGMKQKITIMAALVHNPKVWILDEPLTGLDPNSIYQVKECMKAHAREGNIVFFSSHIIDVVEKICDRIAIIKKGKILCDVSVKELEEKNIVLEEFYLETINEELIKQYENDKPVENNDNKKKKSKKSASGENK